MESEGIEVKDSELIPFDPYTLKLMNKNDNEKQRIDSSSDRSSFNNNMDGKILKFYAILDDSNQSCDIIRKFIIHVI